LGIKKQDGDKVAILVEVKSYFFFFAAGFFAAAFFLAAMCTHLRSMKCEIHGPAL
jgi:hypothetical protein